MEFEKLYMFNPFKIQNATVQEISDTYANLQAKIDIDADTGFKLSDNIEIYSNMNALLGEMIARIQQQYDILKTEISITENKQIYISRKQWQETQKEKAPAMSYFEAMAKDFVKKELIELANLNADLTRFKKFYESIDSKQNALKKKIEAIRYEI